MTKHVLYYSPDYFCEGYEIDTREKARDVVRSLDEDPIPGVEVVSPRAATFEEIAAVHDPRYVEAIFTGSPRDLADRNGLGEWTPELSRSVLASTGGVICAVEKALTENSNAGSASSGLHHARYDHGNGFCTVNGLVVAARKVLTLGATRVLILDLDAHCGGGTASLINGVKGIEQVDVSVNQFDSYRSTENSRLHISNGRTYLSDICEALRGIESPHSIDLLIYNAGMDPHEDCRIGGAVGITSEILKQREETVFKWARVNGVPVVLTFAGGYKGGQLSGQSLVELHRLSLNALVVQGE